MKINKINLGFGIFNICMGIIIIIMGSSIRSWIYFLGLVILIWGILKFLSGIQLNKNEVLK